MSARFHLYLCGRIAAEWLIDMIEFKGYLTGSAEKRFFKRSITYAQTQYMAGIVLGLPVLPILAKIIRPKFTPEVTLYTLLGILVAILLGPILVRIPQSARAKRARTPNRVYIEEELIVCVADKYQECRKINDVKKVRDFGEFYEIVFSLDRLSEKFICQKELLVKGSIQDFERLFDGKIEHKC